MMKRTKIVATIGPACEDQQILEDMVHAGMNVCRLNFSHGTYENHEMLINNIRTVAKKTGQPIAIMQDLQGPKIRVGNMPEEGIALVEGSTVTFDTAIDAYAGDAIPVGYKELHDMVGPDERMLLNDGKMEVKVTAVEGTRIAVTVVVGGNLTAHKGINIPDSRISVSAMTDKDKEDARFGIAHGVDLIALSFVTKPEDVTQLRALIEAEQQEGEAPIGIITKIERREAVERIDEILAVADGVMVARGDLGVETPAEHVPVLQKDIIGKALAHAKPVIVATQMLDSMIDNPRPTRAEVSDVANAVIDHADATMLSNETATGKHPIDAVDIMTRTIADTEASHYDDLPLVEPAAGETDKDVIFAELSRLLAEETGACAILLASQDGVVARQVSRYRPELPIVVAVPHARLAHQLNLSWGVHAFVSSANSVDALIADGGAFLKKNHICDEGDTIIVLEADPLGASQAETGLAVRSI